MASLQRILSVILAISLHLVLAYDGDTCCKLAKERRVFLDPPQNQTCGQNYDANKTAAEPLYISYTWCASNCKGIGLSKANEPSQWAAPLVQFILPSVIFSMTIPRRKKIEFDYLFDWPVNLTTQDRYRWVNNSVQLGVSFLCFMIIMIPVFIDTIIWISVIVIGAGNMLVGGLYEAHLDYRIVKYVEGLDNDEDTLDLKRELLVTITAGNLQLEKGDPQTTILKSLTIAPMGDVDSGREKSRSRLLNLLGAQSSFGSAVGSPVLFFLGAFVYTILDLRSDPSSEDAAISLGFGMEWMIIVHVAIVSGCLLASNNPSTSAGIVGADHEAMPPPTQLRNSSTFTNDPHLDKPIHESAWERFSRKILGWSDAYDTKFQPVSLWSRGINKMKWIKQSQAWKNEGFKEELHISAWGWIFKILIPAVSLIALPPAAGGVVAYFTPPRGLGCRSLSFIVYAISQVVVTLIATARNAIDDGKRDTFLKRLLTGRGFRAISLLFWFGSLVAAIGGTTMQITGVYRNCICYAGATNWYDIHRINPRINVAADTQESRDSSGFWVWNSSIATVFMAVNCYFGWWYQKLIRHRFTEAVKNMYTPLPNVRYQRTSSSSAPSTSGDSSRPLLSDETAVPPAPPRPYTSRLDTGRRSTWGRESSIDSQGSTAGSYRPASEATGEDIGLSTLTPRTPRLRANS